MNRPVDLLALVLTGIAVVAVLLPILIKRRLPRWPGFSTVFAAGLFLLALGGWLFSADVAFWVGVSAAVLLAGLIVLLLLTGEWWPQVVLSVLGLFVLAVGGMTLKELAALLNQVGSDILSFEFVHPWALFLLLVLLPPLLAAAPRSLGFVTRDERQWFWRRVFPILTIGGIVLLAGPVTVLSLGWDRRWIAVPPAPRTRNLIFLAVLAGSLLLTAGFVAFWLRRIAFRLKGLTWRPWVSLTLRALGLVALVLAIAEPRLKQTNDSLTVLFVVDRSQSIPEEPVEDPDHPGVRFDRRARRLTRFINESIEQRGSGRERDRAGLIVFGRRPRLELPPTDAPRLNLKDLPPAPDGQYTDIAAALKLALASFPEGTGKRMVLISDGNENLGNAEEQARLAQTLGVQIDVLPLAAGQRNEDEILIERVEAPPVTEQGANIPVRVLVRSFNPNNVIGRLTLKQITEKERDLRVRRDRNGSLGVRVEPLAGPRGVRITELAPESPLALAGLQVNDEIHKVDDKELKEGDRVGPVTTRGKPAETVTLTIRRDGVKLVGDKMVKLRQGLNSFSFTRNLTDEQRSYTYEAEIQPPFQIVDDAGKVLHVGLVGDRVQNNRASTHVVARGQRRVLVLENRPAERENEVVNSLLVEKLRAAGDRKLRVDVRPVEVLNNYPGRDKLTVFLSDYDCVILANVPAEKVSEEQQEVLRTNTQDQGCGLVMIGGPDSYGAGGWQNTPVEKALPVDMDIKDLKVQGRGGLVLIMHASEIADGNMWQKKIAKLAIERLGPADMVGVIVFDFASKWHIPFQDVGANKAGLLAKVDTLVPGDMPDFDPALDLAYKELTNPKHALSTKHIILISDGDPAQSMPLAKFRTNKVTVTTVGVATHGIGEDQKMSLIARATGGRTYSVKNPNQLPAIYIKESRLVSQSFVEEKRFRPIVTFRSGPTDKLPDPPDLRGFVRTQAKTSPLVEMSMITPKFADQEFPLLAYWHYGLGKSVAFTSDAGDPRFWARDWVEGGAGGEGIYAKFWEQVIEWSLRPTESSKLIMTTDYRDGKIHIVVEARNEQNQPDTKLQLRGGVTLPAAEGTQRPLKFSQKNSGQYEAEIKADEAGSYFINAQAVRLVKVKGKDGKEREVEEGVDSVRAGITLPYSPEFADLESNTPLLRRIQELTGGRLYQDEDRALADAARSGDVFRRGLPVVESLLPLWPWLIVLAGLLLFADVAVRRIALDLTEPKYQAARLWARLRGLPVPEPTRTAYLERLGGKPATGGVRQPTEARGQAARRFEATGPSLAPTMADAASMGEPRPTAPRPTARSEGSSFPTEPEASGDALERLRKAKKKVWEERDKDPS